MNTLPRSINPLRAYRAFIFKLILLLTLGLTSCELERTGVAWETAVNPQLVCPGDTVDVRWNTGEIREACLTGCTESGCPEGCPDAIRVHISSEPSDVLPAFATSRQSGNRLVSISEDTTFNFAARDGDGDALATYNHSVQVIVPDRVTIVEGTFHGVCSGASPAWSPLSFEVDVVRSDNVRILQICNNNTFAIRLGAASATGSTPFSTLEPSECISTDDGSLPPNVEIITAAPIARLDPVTRCEPTSSVPPIDFTATVTLACGLK